MGGIRCGGQMMGQAMGVVGAVVGGCVLDNRDGVRLAVKRDDSRVVEIAFGVVGVEQVLGIVVDELVRDHLGPFFSAALTEGAL